MTQKYTRREIDENYLKSFMSSYDAKNIDKFMAYVEIYGVEIVYALYHSDKISILDSHDLVCLSTTNDKYVQQKYSLSGEVMDMIDTDKALEKLERAGELYVCDVNTMTAFFEPKDRE